MSNWIHRLLKPHCQECRDEKRDSHICKSCETLQAQLELANFEKRQLLDRILAKPEVEVAKPPIEMTRPLNIPWGVRRQMLEAEDREKARLMRQAPKPEPIPTEDLEKDLNLAATEREAEGKG